MKIAHKIAQQSSASLVSTRRASARREPGQTTQRVRVGMIGLAAVLLMIGLAAAIFSTASHEAAVTGSARPDIVANLTLTNAFVGAGDTPSEPLAELGVAPSTATENVNVAQIADTVDAQHPAGK